MATAKCWGIWMCSSKANSLIPVCCSTFDEALTLVGRLHLRQTHEIIYCYLQKGWHSRKLRNVSTRLPPEGPKITVIGQYLCNYDVLDSE